LRGCVQKKKEWRKKNRLAKRRRWCWGGEKKKDVGRQGGTRGNLPKKMSEIQRGIEGGDENGGETERGLHNGKSQAFRTEGGLM